MTTQESQASAAAPNSTSDNDKMIDTLRKELAAAELLAKENKDAADHHYQELMELQQHLRQERFMKTMYTVVVVAIVSLIAVLIYGNVDRRADAELAARSWATGSLGYPRQSTTAACRTGIMRYGTLCVVRSGNASDGRMAYVNCDGSRWNNSGCYPIRAQVYYGIGSVDALDVPASTANQR